MFDRNPSSPTASGPGRRSLIRLFGDLNVRPKLMILHNLFFLILTGGVYFSVIPVVEKQEADVRAREFAIIQKILSADVPLMANAPGMELYEYREGDATALGLSPETQRWLDSHAGEIFDNIKKTDYLFRKNPKTGFYRSLRLPREFYVSAVEQARFKLFLVLGVIYLLAVMVLELLMMPLYVYRPLRMMLDADQATQQGDRSQEIIDEDQIFGDEIGQLMRSRNRTVGELRRHEDDLESALKSLEEQDRLASLGLLSASVAHEVNTPLAVLHGSIEKMMETTRDPASLDRLARMKRVTERLRTISADLLDFARARKQVTGCVDLRPLIDEAWTLVAIDEKAGSVRFVNDADPGHQVEANGDRLMQVFVNLLRNALNAVSPSGTIVVKSAVTQNGGPNWVSIRVEDDGPGIPPDVLPEIFDAFVTTRLDSRGTGLGLTVAEGIVTQHGGTISACNRPEGGACLEVRLPAAGCEHKVLRVERKRLGSDDKRRSEHV